MLTEAEELEILRELGTELSHIHDLDILMEKVLTQARYFVNADAGTIYIREGGGLNSKYAQNDTLQERLGKHEKLVYSSFAMPINTHSMAGYVAETGQVLNIKNAYELLPTVPYHFDRNFDEKSNYKTESVLTLPLTTPKDDCLGVIQVINAKDEGKNIIPFTVHAEKMMSHFASIAAVALERAHLTRAIILRMMRMAQIHDPKETGAHISRVGAFSTEIYEHWANGRSLPQEEIEKNRDILRMAAMLHDVGKVGISDIILKKPGRLTKSEDEIMKNHTLLGFQLFDDSKSELDDAAAIVALNHHEKWNGTGYPGHIDVRTASSQKAENKLGKNSKGKETEEIPIFGRIVALADVFDALSSARVYKDAWDEKDVLATIEKESGEHFDPELVEIFFSILDNIRGIQERFKDKP